MPSGFVPNKNFPNELESEPKYTEGLAGEAQRAVDLAKGFAPVGPSSPGEHYRDQLKVVVDGKKVYASAQKFTSHWIEYGTVDTPPFSPLRRGAKAAGLQFKEQGRR